MSIADDLVDALAPWLTDDLEDYARAVGSMFEEVETLAFDTDDAEGWTSLFDPYAARVADLPYLGVVVGERLSVGLDEAIKREWVATTPNRTRGTVTAFAATVQRWLTGERHVGFLERYGPSGPHPDWVTVITFESETIDPARLEAELRAVLPADVALNYQLETGMTWSLVDTTYDDWGEVKDVGTWGELLTDLSGVRFFT